MGEHDGVYRYVRWHDVEEFKAKGWVLVEVFGLAPHHDVYSALMRWAGEGEPK